MYHPRAPSICVPIVLLLIYFALCVHSAEVKVHKRAKRMLWLTHNRKFVLPQGTILDIAPKLQIPFIRQPPEGLNSDIQITWHFYMYFDKLGMTSGQHPWPLPFLYPFSGFFPFGRLPMPRPGQNGQNGDGGNGDNGNDNRGGNRGNVADGNKGGGSPFKKMDHRNGPVKEKADPTIVNSKPYKPSKRVPRSILSLPPPDKLPGGERATLIPQLEKMMSSVGYDGRACLLRAVCEIHEYPLHKTGFGLLGEILTLVFSVSKSMYADSHLPEYLKAEEAGKAGECSSYFRNCTKSVFMWEERNKYSKEMQKNFDHNNVDNQSSQKQKQQQQQKNQPRSSLDFEIERSAQNCNGLNCKDPNNGYNYFFENETGDELIEYAHEDKFD